MKKVFAQSIRLASVLLVGFFFACSALSFGRHSAGVFL